ncbi:MAG TPA: hypothetical protein VII95_06915, partial [Terriglobales bacterium]
MESASRTSTRYLLIIPALLFVLSSVLTSKAGPYYLVYNSDPDYAYLFNALDILEFTEPRLMEHPGTTLQELGAAVIFVTWSIRSVAGHTQSLEEAVLADPEAFLHAINLALNLLVCAAVFICARSIYSHSRSLLAALGFEAAIWLFPQVLIAQTRVSPEPLLVAVACAFFIPFVPLLFGGERSDYTARPWTAYTSGALFAFGVVTKVTFLPLGAFSLLLAGWRQISRFWLAFCCGFLILTLPIFTLLPTAGNWLLSILLHRGFYGTGAKGLPTPDAFSAGLQMIYHTEPYLFVALSYFLFLSISGRFLLPSSYDVKPASRFLLLGGVVIVIQVLITAAHPAIQVGLYDIRYIVPVLVVPAFAVAILIDVSLNVRPRHWPAALIVGIGGVLLALGLVRSALTVDEWVATRNAYREEVRNIALAGPKDCLRMGFYPSSLPSFALEFGNAWSGGVHAPILQSLYPRTLLFGSGHFSSFGREVPDSEIQRRLESGACILAEGNVVQFGGLPELSEKVVATPVFNGAHESLFRLASKGLPTPPAVGASASSGATSITVNSSAGVQRGDVIFCYVGTHDNAANITVTTPTGWTLIAGPLNPTTGIESYL